MRGAGLSHAPPLLLCELGSRQHAQMTKAPVVAETRGEAAPATLGDVLYANGKVAPPEQEWASLVQSIAAGDQLALHALYARAHRVVFTLAVRITANREAAEEITVEVFHDIWRSASGY